MELNDNILSPGYYERNPDDITNEMHDPHEELVIVHGIGRMLPIQAFQQMAALAEMVNENGYCGSDINTMRYLQVYTKAVADWQAYNENNGRKLE